MSLDKFQELLDVMNAMTNDSHSELTLCFRVGQLMMQALRSDPETQEHPEYLGDKFPFVTLRSELDRLKQKHNVFEGITAEMGSRRAFRDLYYFERIEKLQQHLPEEFSRLSQLSQKNEWEQKESGDVARRQQITPPIKCSQIEWLAFVLYHSGHGTQTAVAHKIEETQKRKYCQGQVSRAVNKVEKLLEFAADHNGILSPEQQPTPDMVTMSPFLLEKGPRLDGRTSKN
ncbi:MAG: hypothetical protein HUJ26_04580 [Planctomycetaceae bacterium]|nr:hypothetical protein [Planctomycetaceae bacterium]